MVAHLSDVLGGGAQMMEPTGKVHSVGAVRYSGRNAWVEGIDDAGQKWLITMNRAVMKSALARAARSTRRVVEDWEHAGYNFAPLWTDTRWRGSTHKRPSRSHGRS